MAIYKLGELYSNDPQYGVNEKALESGLYHYVRQSDIRSSSFDKYVNSGPLLKKNDVLISRVGANAGDTYIHKLEGDYVYAGYLVRYKFNKKILLDEYFYYWTKTTLYQRQLKSLRTGAAQPQFNPPMVGNIQIDVPSIQEQQKIIDIIEQKEELFLKFSKTVRIDTFEHTKNDLKNLIDIIEPLEILSTKIEATKKMIISLLKMIANNKVEKTNELLINHLIFEKGKNGPKEFESSGTPFLDVRTLNTRIPSKFVKDQPNTFKGDILLSLDATVGLVDWFIEGFNGYLYNLKSNYLTKVEILLNVLNDNNKKIIEMNATGSTIKHASKAKKEMLYFKLDQQWKDIANILFKLLLLIEEIDAKKIKLYQLCVNLLIR